MLPSYVSGQSDRKQERLHGNKAQGLSSEAGFMATALSESLLRGRQYGAVESAWVLRPGCLKWDDSETLI